jgi:hypothetical protein
MPQIGQSPGASRRISGCMGQVQMVAPASAVTLTAAGADAAGSRYFAGSAAKRSRQRAEQK